MSQLPGVELQLPQFMHISRDLTSDPPTPHKPLGGCKDWLALDVRPTAEASGHVVWLGSGDGGEGADLEMVHTLP